MKVSVLVCMLALVIFPSLYPVVILVHGSFSSKELWWRPGGDFFNCLESAAQSQGHAVIPFCWSGDPSDYELTMAAHILCKLLISYSAGEPKILIGHSHGGNVINLATVLFADYLEKNQITMLSLSTGYQQNSCLLGTNVQSFDLVSRVKPELTARYPIDRVYLLGTPVKSTKFIPQMSIIGTFVNIFSTGDAIQQVGCLYTRRYPLQERLTNISVTCRIAGGKEVWPGHSELHNATIGKWLLHIPYELSKSGVGNFGKFRCNVNAHILFDTDSFPTYFLPLQFDC